MEIVLRSYFGSGISLSVFKYFFFKKFLSFSRTLRIPGHVSILYVEQEVTGDDTIALESVLECDTQRKDLLDREKEIQAKILRG